MDINQVYIPEIIPDKKPKEIFYWTTDSERQRIEDEEVKKKQEIENMDFTYEDLQNIDDVTKDEYMKRILNEDA